MNIDPEISKAAPGLVGAFIAMWRLQGMSIPQRLTSLACGVACSYWGTNTVVKLAPVMSEGLTGFVLGLFGMTLVSKVFELLDELKPLEMLRLFIQKRKP